VALQDEPPAVIPYYASDSVTAVVADAALALAGTGFLLTRDLPAALARLDLRRVGLRQAGWAGAAALGMLAAVGVLDWTERVVLPGVHERKTRFGYEFVGVSPLSGAALVSGAAGVGEELVFRGALQPRLGIGLTAALFALLHVQYQLPGILMIFAVGLALGFIKRRLSTTGAVIAHVVYDVGMFLAFAG
jgi:membrane protease YdiL (CAAX protease family)